MFFRSFILLLLTCTLTTTITTEPITQQAEPTKIVIFSESQKLKLEEKRKQEEDRKLSISAYDKLSNAIAANDLSAVETLFNEHPRLRSYAHHNEGTPLHFARSQAMVQFLVEKAGFDTNRCDEWGALPATTILATRDQFFPTTQEKMAIANYLKSREKRFAKIYFQLKNNKNIHRKTCAFGLATLLLGLDCYFLAKISHRLTWR